MKTIIAGSRNITNYQLLEKSIKDSDFEITEVICGGARGVDNLGKKWAIENQIPVKMFPAQWNKFGKSAGYKRNIEMAEYGESLIALWDGISFGTKHMIDIAIEKGLNVYIHKVEE